MPDYPGIDLRGRVMLHPPWRRGGQNVRIAKDRANLFPRPASAVINIVSAYEEAGGSAGELITLLNRHLPASAEPLKIDDLKNSRSSYSMEFYFYLVNFAKFLLDDIYFCYKVDEETQLGWQYIIFEKGPLDFPPWVVDEGRHVDGYLSITNLASTFHYVEEELRILNSPEDSVDLGMRISKECLEYLNSCAPEKYRVTRSFFEKEGVLISFEYISYAVGIFSALSNDELFIGHAHYYGHLHNNQLARAAFMQPSFSPVDSFREWLSRTNDVYKMEFRSGFRTLWIKINMRTPIKTGMFGRYRANSSNEIRQAVIASHRAFLELATRKRVKARLVPIKNQPYVFWVKIKWHPPHSSALTPVFSVGAGLSAAAVFFGFRYLLPQWETVLTITILAVIAGAAAALTSNYRCKLKAARKGFSSSKDVIDKQLISLKETANELIRERDSLETRVSERTAELNRALEQLKALDRGKTNFIANVSHELRTPLTLLSVPLEGVREGRYGTDISMKHPLFALLERNVARLKTRINQLLDFSRLDLDTMPFEPKKIDILSYSSGLIAELSSLAEQKGLTLKVENETGLEHPVVLADGNLLETAVLNLLNNALKFTEAGGIRIILSPAAGDDEGSKVRLAVEDTGIGFNPEEKERIFLRFTQAEEHRGRHHEGTGLGLALTSEIARRHGWLLEAESSPGEGAVFSLVMRLLTADPEEVHSAVPGSRRARAETGLQAPPSCSETEHMSGRDTILLVEDNTDMADVLKALLGSLYNLHWCSGGPEALEYLAGCPDVSLILCDVMMPGMSGFVFREKLMKNSCYRELPFVFLTALADPEDRSQGLQSGAVDYIQKPFVGSELVLKIQNLIDSNKAAYRQAVTDQQGALRLSRAAGESLEKMPGAIRADYGITDAEARVAELVRRGLQDKEIAAELSVSPRTVSSHLSHLYQKTDTQNRVELINLLYKQI